MFGDSCVSFKSTLLLLFVMGGIRKDVDVTLLTNLFVTLVLIPNHYAGAGKYPAVLLFILIWNVALT